MNSYWIDCMNIGAYSFFTYYNPYALNALVWESVNLLEKILE